MKTLLAGALSALFGTFASMAGTAVTGHADSQPTLVAIVHPSEGLSNIDTVELRRIFMGVVRHGRSGHRMIPFNYRPGSAERVFFDQRVLLLRPDEVSRYWVAERIRVRRSPPRIVSSPLLLRRVVSRVAGAIGYLPIELLDKSVKPLAIDGKKPGDPSYVLAP
ncbi:MAG: hypothetical protein OEZ06_11280 [Myxococcales bacterium]|nr:hypothetical protein [Myxococcales bacterium]